MKVAADTEVLIKADEEAVTIKAGNIPKQGEPKKDKNGANVYPIPAGIDILSYDHSTGTKIWSPITSYTEEFNCPCVEVSTITQTVIVSDNQSLTLFNHETGVIEKESPRGAEGRFAPVLNQVGTYGTVGDYNYGWWLGAFVSDGWITENRMIGYAKKEQAKRDLFVKVAREQIHDNFTARTYEGKGTCTKFKYADSVKVHLSGRDLAERVTALNLTAPSSAGERQAIKKNIPDTLLNQLSEKALWGVLAGLIDGDGSCVKNTTLQKPRYNFRLATSSPSLRDASVKLAYRLGIRTSVTTTPPRNGSKEAYSISFSTIDMKLRSGGHLTFTGEREDRIYKEFMQAEANFGISRDCLPLTHAEAAWVRKVAWSYNEKGLYTVIGKKENRVNTKVNIYKMREFLTTVNQDKGKSELLAILGFGAAAYAVLLRRVFSTDVRWEAIRTVTDAGKRSVYDFEVQGTKIFATGNGLIIWDTMGYHVPASDKAVAEAYEKMLPSKNLFRVTTLGDAQHKNRSVV